MPVQDKNNQHLQAKLVLSADLEKRIKLQIYENNPFVANFCVKQNIYLLKHPYPVIWLPFLHTAFATDSLQAALHL